MSFLYVAVEEHAALAKRELERQRDCLHFCPSRSSPLMRSLPLSRCLPSFSCQLNPEINAFQRSFVGDIRRLDEMERRIRLFTSQINSVSSPAIHVPSLESTPPFITVGPRGPQAIDDLDTNLTDHEGRLGQMNSSWETLVKKQRELEEAKCVLRETAVFFQQVRIALSE